MHFSLKIRQGTLATCNFQFANTGKYDTIVKLCYLKLDGTVKILRCPNIQDMEGKKL